jgi:hypothetical protein
VEDGGEILLRCGSSADDDDVKTRFAASAIRASDDCSNLDAMVYNWWFLFFVFCV